MVPRTNNANLDDAVGTLKTKNSFPVLSLTLDKKIQILIQRQPSRGVLRKRCSENMQQIYKRTPMPKRDFNKVAKKKSTSTELLLLIASLKYIQVLKY